MARIAKSGLEYFPFDIDFFQDIRIRKLIKRQGGKAVTVYALLLCLIYKNGYYMQWDQELPFIGSEISGFDEAYISEVIRACLTLGLFNKTLFDTEKVLTSKGIQIRYCNIQRLNKRMSRIEEYSLLDEQSPSSQLPNAPTPKLPDPAPVPGVSTPRPIPSNSQYLSEFFAPDQEENIRLLCKNFGLPPGDTDRIREAANAIIAEWEISRTEHQDYTDWSRHLISAMRIKLRPASSGSNSSTPETNPFDEYRKQLRQGR